MSTALRDLLNDKIVKDLVAISKEIGIKNAKNIKKADLIDIICMTFTTVEIFNEAFSNKDLTDIKYKLSDLTANSPSLSSNHKELIIRCSFKEKRL